MLLTDKNIIGLAELAALDPMVSQVDAVEGGGLIEAAQGAWDEVATWLGTAYGAAGRGYGIGSYTASSLYGTFGGKSNLFLHTDVVMREPGGPESPLEMAIKYSALSRFWRAAKSRSTSDLYDAKYLQSESDKEAAMAALREWPIPIVEPSLPRPGAFYAPWKNYEAPLAVVKSAATGSAMSLYVSSAWVEPYAQSAISDPIVIDLADNETASVRQLPIAAGVDRTSWRLAFGLSPGAMYWATGGPVAVGTAVSDIRTAYNASVVARAAVGSAGEGQMPTRYVPFRQLFLRGG